MSSQEEFAIPEVDFAALAHTKGTHRDNAQAPTFQQQTTETPTELASGKLDLISQWGHKGDNRGQTSGSRVISSFSGQPMPLECYESG